MAGSSGTATATVRILPNNKVYRQLFDAQVQLSDAYNRVRNNQLSQPVTIVAHPDATPLVRNIRPHETQRRQWLSSLPYSNDPNINPVALLWHAERERHQTDRQRELDEIKQEVFNLPDRIESVEDESSGNKENITERLATNRKAKFDELWTEFLEKIKEINKKLLQELETITRECNSYYERGDQELDDVFQKMIYQKEITSLTIHSFEQAYDELDRFLSPRLAQIQDYCQAIEELELERIRKIRELFKFYSERLYKTHHMSDRDTAGRLEKQANELNVQVFDNRRTYAELEARLLTSETDRTHRYRAGLVDYQNQWRDATWLIHKQTWISKLAQCKAKFQSTIISSCELIGSDIGEQTRLFIEHIDSLNSYIPPESTRENIRKWFNQGRDLLDEIVSKRQELIRQIKQIILNEIELLEKESQLVREKVLTTQVYTSEQAQSVIERDIEPLLAERKRFLKESIIDRIEVTYERETNFMLTILDHLHSFMQPPAEQWDEHLNRLEHVTGQLVDLMRDCRRPHDLQNEKKLTRLDATLDEMRSASNETALSRLLASAYEQLDLIKSSYGQFYEIEHGIVNKYSSMILEEVTRYKQEMLAYLHAREVNIDENQSANHNSRYYTTSVARTTYELEGYSEDLMDGEEAKPASSSDDPEMPTFLTEDPTSYPDDVSTNETIPIPFHEEFQIPPRLFQSTLFNLCRAFLDYYDQWQEETARRADAVMYSKHDELDKEMDFQMHLHEPRRVRVETDIHNVRAAELVMHDERVERHIRGVQETLEQTDADYRRMLNEFGKSIVTYQEDIFGLEQVFVDATTTGRLHSLQSRLKKQRDTFMDNVRISLRQFRKRFDDAMQYLRQANAKFRKSFKMFSDGGNFSREEIEIHRKKLEKTSLQIDKAETAILKEMEKLEKKQLEEATKIMNQFQERFKNHMTDLQFIELTNRWISETQVKIKSEVAVNNQQAHALKTLITSYRTQIDSIQNPNLDKQISTLSDVRELFHQIVLTSYERSLYLKALNNELIIPASIVTILKDKGLITEEELVNDLLNVAEEGNTSRRPSRVSGITSDETKSVKFASSTATTSTSRHKTESIGPTGPGAGQAEDAHTISTIRMLLHKTEQQESDEITEPGVTAATTLNARSIASGSSSRSSHTKKSTPKQKQERKSKRSPSHKGSADEAVRRDRPGRAKTRDEIYALYCTFGEKKHSGKDFLSNIVNILRESTEGLLTHAEMFYREKGARPVTRPQALREKFDDYAQTMVDKLQNYEIQCQQHHEHSVKEFRDDLELFERTSSILPKLEIHQQMREAERVLLEIKQQFDLTLNNGLNQLNEKKTENFEQLRPTLGHPSRKIDRQELDHREQFRQDEFQQMINQLRTTTIEEIKTNAQLTVETLARNAERLLILFDDLLTADEVIRTKLPPTKQPLAELLRRQQEKRPLEDAEPPPLLERKQGNWPGLPLLDDPLNRKQASVNNKKRQSTSSHRQRTSASVVTQKTTLPQIETISQRDSAYQHFKEIFVQILTDIEQYCSMALIELDRHRTHWTTSMEKLQQLRTC